MSEDLKARLFAGLAASPVVTGGDFILDRHVPAPGAVSLKPAAVLVPIIEHPQGLTMLLTRRAEGLSSHASQVAFPGGRIDPGDATPADAALREAEEEIGLARRFVRIIGALDIYETGSGFRIHPMVGLVTPGFSLSLHAPEVADVFEVPLAFLMDKRNHERHSATFEGRERIFYAIPFEGRNIWGATAGMIVNLYDKLYSL